MNPKLLAAAAIFAVIGRTVAVVAADGGRLPPAWTPVLALLALAAISCLVVGLLTKDPER